MPAPKRPEPSTWEHASYHLLPKGHGKHALAITDPQHVNYIRKRRLLDRQLLKVIQIELQEELHLHVSLTTLSQISRFKIYTHIPPDPELQAALEQASD